MAVEKIWYRAEFEIIHHCSGNVRVEQRCMQIRIGMIKQFVYFEQRVSG